MRLTRRKLKERYAAEYAAIRLEVESELYPHVLAHYIETHPESMPGWTP